MRGENRHQDGMRTKLLCCARAKLCITAAIAIPNQPFSNSEIRPVRPMIFWIASCCSLILQFFLPFACSLLLGSSRTAAQGATGGRGLVRRRTPQTGKAPKQKGTYRNNCGRSDEAGRVARRRLVRLPCVARVEPAPNPPTAKSDS